MRGLIRLLLATFRAGCCWLSDSESSSDQITNQTDKRISGRDGAQVSGDGNTVLVQASDYGAVQAGTELARNALTMNTAIAALSIDTVAADTQKTFSQALAGLGKAYETAKAGDQRIVSMVGLAVIGLAAIMVVPAIFKKG